MSVVAGVVGTALAEVVWAALADVVWPALADVVWPAQRKLHDATAMRIKNHSFGNMLSYELCL